MIFISLVNKIVYIPYRDNKPSLGNEGEGENKGKDIPLV